MSIVDAIEKAKAMAKQRVSAEPRALAHEAPVRTVVSAPEVTAPHPFVEPVSFDVVIPYDIAVCASNHVNVPGVETDFAKLASAPYRMLRTLILQRCRTNGWSSLAITSPGPGEGKSVSAINLAISIAREGNYDVFLIDLDMRAPSVAQYLGLSPRVDIVDYFEGNASPRDVFFTIGIDRLAVAASAGSCDHSSELLGNGRLEDLLVFIRRGAPNPLIIIDLPPIVNADDALVVAPKVDATALIVSQGHTRRDGLQRALGLLSAHSLAGVILNRSQESLGSDYYGQYGAQR
ncbi:MAG: CpsD/CapB family tyrosine-protein kinase [Pseudomonadota bacterium]